MAEQNPIPTQVNIAPRGKSWQGGKLVTWIGGHPTRETMLHSARQTLISHADGRVSHARQGSCPDEVSGHDVRDDECPVCQALMALDMV